VGDAAADGAPPFPAASGPVAGWAAARAHGRSRGIDTNSSASIAPTVTMTSTIRGVWTIDSHTTLPAKRAAHRYMIRTLVRCEWPMSSMR
jgi:hypothetical protein